MTNVPVGPSTVAGYGVSAAAFVGAVLAFVAGDHSQVVLGTIAFGAIGGGSFLVTQLGRYRQAGELAKRVSAHPLLPPLPGATGTTASRAPVVSRPSAVDDDEHLPADELPPDAADLVPTAPSDVPPDEGDPGAPTAKETTP